MREHRGLSRKTSVFYWLVGSSLFLGSLVFIWLYSPSLNSPRNIVELESSPRVQESPPSDILLSAVEVDAVSDQVEALHPLDFPIGSVEEACGMHEIPIDGLGRFSRFDFTSDSVEYLALENSTCWAAMEKYIHTQNPYLFLDTEANPAVPTSPLALIGLDEPLTFQRIFADPMGDFFLVQDALSRPECLLSPTEANWDLKDSCHADSLTNFALINRLCFDPYDPGRPESDILNDYTMSEIEDYERRYLRQPVNPLPVGNYKPVPPQNRQKRWNYDGLGKARRSRYSEPSPEQAVSTYKQRLADAWIFKKCGQLDAQLEFTPERHLQLYEAAMSFESNAERKKRFLRQLDVKNVREHLIELAARLGDEAAGLSKGGYLMYEDGYQFGRLAQSLTSSEWEVFAWKDTPSVAGFLAKFKVLVKIQRRTDYQLNWEFISRHLCEPPQPSWNGIITPSKYMVESRSCQSVISELRQLIPRPTEPQQQSDSVNRLRGELHDIMDKIEQVTVDLDLYD